MSTLPDGLPIPEAATRLGVSEKTIRRRLEAGELSGYKVHTQRGPAWRVVLPATVDATIDTLPTLDDQHGQTVDNQAVAAVLLYLVGVIEAQDARLMALESPALAPPIPILAREVIETEAALSTVKGTVGNGVDNAPSWGIWARLRGWFTERP